MKTNMGMSDRVIRFEIGVIMASLCSAHVITGAPGTIVYIFSGILLLTSLAGFCPLYLPVGINTFKQEKKSLRHLGT